MLLSWCINFRTSSIFVVGATGTTASPTDRKLIFTMFRVIKIIYSSRVHYFSSHQPCYFHYVIDHNFCIRMRSCGLTAPMHIKPPAAHYIPDHWMIFVGISFVARKGIERRSLLNTHLLRIWPVFFISCLLWSRLWFFKMSSSARMYFELSYFFIIGLFNIILYFRVNGQVELVEQNVMFAKCRITCKRLGSVSSHQSKQRQNIILSFKLAINNFAHTSAVIQLLSA